MRKAGNPFQSKLFVFCGLITAGVRETGKAALSDRPDMIDSGSHLALPNRHAVSGVCAGKPKITNVFKYPGIFAAFPVAIAAGATSVAHGHADELKAYR
jgi:hypothetical protein